MSNVLDDEIGHVLKVARFIDRVIVAALGKLFPDFSPRSADREKLLHMGGPVKGG